jgi:UDP-N-acetylmuramate dehydrogenase
MKILSDLSLARHTTMHIGGPAHEIIELSNESDVKEAVHYAKNKNYPLLVIGQGSNIVFGDNGFDGCVLINKIDGLSINKISGLVKIGGGTSWHRVVIETVAAGLVGIEAMAMIPGTTGATPVNNIGAYGQELKDVFVSLRAYDISKDTFVTFNKVDCQFSYRNSRFKGKDHGRYIITEVTLQLNQTPAHYLAPTYPSLEDRLLSKGITTPTPIDVMKTVMEIRSEKLPDPSHLASVGSFFKNPIVSKFKADALVKLYPEIPVFKVPGSDDVKLSGGWLIEKAGLKGMHKDGIWVFEGSALVLVNENNATFKNLWTVVSHIQSTVSTLFGVKLEPEPEIFK